MKIAIHHRENSFSENWIKHCEANNVPYKLVNCYANDIVDQMTDCDALMWHHNHANPKDILFAKPLLYALEHAGKKVFPDFKTSWHFDDKVGQKYLQEALDVPAVRSYAFYTEKEALAWVGTTTFPKVFKLRGGAGSANVILARSRRQAAALVKKAFGRGFSQYEGWSNLKERLRKFGKGTASARDVAKGIVRLAYAPQYSRIKGNERGYAYFQDFIPNNDHDIRVVLINDKAFAIKRMVRDNDFRASGSGHILYDKELFSDALIARSFEVADKIKSQCLAIDFVFLDGEPLVVEISYGFTKEGYYNCPGYWDKSLKWHEGRFDAQGWMVDLVLEQIHKDK
jgi:glutathione synthase/RimK-type ligase-like ATP-grasp enzyme